MNKIISFTFLSLCISTLSIAMDRVPSNQKQRNEHLSKETESPTSLRKNISQRKEKEKQATLKRSQERSIKYSSEYNK